MEKIKVLHMITHLGIGGAQDNTLITVKGHSRDRFEVHLAAGRDFVDWEYLGPEYADAFFNIPGLQRSVKPWADIYALRQISDFLKKNKYDIVHTHSAKAGTLGRIAARRAGVPIIIHTYHGFGWQVTRTAQTSPLHKILSSTKKKYYVMIEQYAASLSDALITVSELNRQEALEIGLAPPEKFTTIYSGIDLDRFDERADRAEMCKSLGLALDKPIIGFIGRLSVQKAPLDFVTAAKSVLKKRPDIQVIMIGDGPLLSDVRQAIADEPGIRLFGYRNDIPQMLSILDAFVLSSLWEGLGRALTEAMIMGVPVVATAVDGVPELVSHRQTGLLSPPGNPHLLAENILWLLNFPEEARQMVRAAKERVIPAFGAERMVEQIENLYERVLIQKGFPIEDRSPEIAYPVLS